MAISTFRYFNTNPEILLPAVMLYIRFALSLRKVGDLPHDRDIEISYKAMLY